MFSFLQPHDGPVVRELESKEIIYAAHQPEYNPLRVLRSTSVQGAVLSRWTLTPEQRQAIANGADIYLELLTFGFPLTPIRVAVGQDVDPDYIREQFGIG